MEKNGIVKVVRNILGFAVEMFFNMGVEGYKKLSPELQREYQQLSEEEKGLWMKNSETVRRKGEINKRKEEIERVESAYNNPKTYDLMDDIVDKIKGE